MTTLYVECPACSQSTETKLSMDGDRYLANHVEVATLGPYWTDDDVPTTMSARWCEGSGRAVNWPKP